MRKIKICYYALLREQRGCREELVETDACDATALYEELKSTHGFSLTPSLLNVAVNDEFVPWTYVLKAGDEVAFLPPAAGG